MEQRPMDDLEHFKNKYRAHIQPGHRRYTKPKKISMYEATNWDLHFETEYGVQIEMSQRDFDHLVQMEKQFYDTMERSGPYVGGHAKYIVEQWDREERIRRDNPAAKKAYEKYLNILHMVDSYYD
jgi:hypothetical protein